MFLEVTFNIDANGILNVTAKEERVLEKSSLLPFKTAEIFQKKILRKHKKMLKHTPMKIRKSVKLSMLVILSENAIYQAEKMPEEHKDKISDEIKTIEEAAATAKAAKDDESADKEKPEAAAKELLIKLWQLVRNFMKLQLKKRSQPKMLARVNNQTKMSRLKAKFTKKTIKSS